MCACARGRFLLTATVQPGYESAGPTFILDERIVEQHAIGVTKGTKDKCASGEPLEHAHTPCACTHAHTRASPHARGTCMACMRACRYLSGELHLEIVVPSTDKVNPSVFPGSITVNAGNQTHRGDGRTEKPAPLQHTMGSAVSSGNELPRINVPVTPKPIRPPARVRKVFYELAALKRVDGRLVPCQPAGTACGQQPSAKEGEGNEGRGVSTPSEPAGGAAAGGRGAAAEEEDDTVREARFLALGPADKTLKLALIALGAELDSWQVSMHALACGMRRAACGVRRAACGTWHRATISHRCHVHAALLDS